MNINRASEAEARITALEPKPKTKTIAPPDTKKEGT